MLRQQIPFFELNGEHEAEIQRMPHEPVGQRRAERHRCVQREAGRLLAASIPGAEFIELDSRNHILLEDQPASRRFQEAVLEFARPDRAVSAAAFAGLSEREPEVLALITDGLSNTDIAARLSSSEKTVRNHTSNVFDKLGVWSRAQAIVFARSRVYVGLRSGGVELCLTRGHLWIRAVPVLFADTRAEPLRVVCAESARRNSGGNSADRRSATGAAGASH